MFWRATASAGPPTVLRKVSVTVRGVSNSGPQPYTGPDGWTIGRSLIALRILRTRRGWLTVKPPGRADPPL
jgi:hypothetical protein